MKNVAGSRKIQVLKILTMKKSDYSDYDQRKEFCEMKIHFWASTTLNGINYSTIHYHAIDYFQYFFLNLVTDKSQKVELWIPYFFSSSF